ncbi:MAG: YjgN family protein [Pseudomonadota bacterium]
MSESSYMVVFRGELIDGADLEQVKESLQTLCKLTREKVEQLFSLPAVVLKKNLSQELAKSFQQQLERIGVRTDVKAMEEAKVVSVSEATIAAAAPQSGDNVVSAIRAEQKEKTTENDNLQVQFHGKGGEYFKIWIVNILLTIVTFGIYSAWAKVRNHRYFYSNTQIGSGSFEYTADPVAILKGRIIAVIFLLVFNYAGTTLPFGGILYLILSIIFVISVPWLVNRSMAFRNRNTVYRNVRFGFDGNYMDALKAFVLWPIAGALTIGILMPYAIYKQKSYVVQGSRYGTSSFASEFGWRDVYGIAIRAFLLMLLAVVLFVVPFVGPLLGMAVYLIVFAYFTANIGNLVYNNSNLLNHGFDSTLDTKELAMIYFVNWLMLVFTFGLAMPWVKVRLAEYRAAHLVVAVDGSLDNFIAAEEKNVSSLGEEIGEAFDIDIGL